MGQTLPLTVGLRSGLSWQEMIQLVGRKEQEYPIIGFSVIEEILSQHSENPQAKSNIIQQSFPSVHRTQVGAVVNCIQ